MNPTNPSRENSDLELTIAGTADSCYMVEAGTTEISEEDHLAAMTFGQGGHRRLLRGSRLPSSPKVNPTPRTTPSTRLPARPWPSASTPTSTRCPRP